MSNRFRALVVDDESANRTVVGRMLLRLGYDVAYAEGAVEACEMLRDESYHPDVMITDVVMSTSTGPELVQQARGLRPHMKVIFMSGHPAEVLRWYDFDPAGTAFISKPFTMFGLDKVLKRVLERG